MRKLSCVDCTHNGGTADSAKITMSRSWVCIKVQGFVWEHQAYFFLQALSFLSERVEIETYFTSLAYCESLYYVYRWYICHICCIVHIAFDTRSLAIIAMSRALTTATDGDDGAGIHRCFQLQPMAEYSRPN